MTRPAPRPSRRVRSGQAPASARCRALLLELSRYLDGELAPARRRAVERHLRACAGCESMEVCLKRTIAACRAEGGTRLPRDVRSRAARRVKALLAIGRTPGGD